MLSKQERLQKFFERLDAAVPASDEDDALELLATILNGVEDEFTSIPYLPDQWMTNDRMYPPQPDSKRKVTDKIARYRNRGHNTYIANNGAIKIETVGSREVVLNKAGYDGKKVGDL